MTDITVKLPDGSTARFPAGTPPDVMKAAIQKKFPPAQPVSASVESPWANAPMVPTEAMLASPTRAPGGGTDRLLDTTADMVGDAYSRAASGMEPDSFGNLNPMPGLRNVGRGLLGGLDMAMSGAAGLAADLMPGLGASSEKRLANDIYAMPEAFAGISPTRAPAVIRADKASEKTGALVRDLLRQSGKSESEVEAILAAARAKGVPLTVADVLGRNAQGALAGIAKTPGSSRDAVMEFLTSRQTGQGERLLPWLDDALGTGGKTAKKIRSELEATRRTDAGVNYPAADAAAGTVNMENVLARADELLSRNPITGDAALANTELGKRVAALTGRVTDGNSVVVDYPTILRVKQDLGRAMKRDPLVASDMAPLYKELDAALEQASEGYRLANDTYKSQTRTMEALDAGKGAVAPTVRASDTVDQFAAMTPDQQAAFRAGYADPLSAKIEGARSTADRTAPLLTDKMLTELGALSNDPKALMDAIMRERNMSETFKRVTGGSQTAENLADMGKFDVGAISNLLRGNVGTAATQAAQKVADKLLGRSEPVKEAIAKALIGQSVAGPLAALPPGIAQRLVQELMKVRKLRTPMTANAALNAEAAQ